MALAAGLALLAMAIAVRVSRPPLAILGTNSVAAEGTIATSRGNATLCQGNEALPGGASAMRLGLSVNIGPRVTVTVMSGSQVIARGERAAGWTGEPLTVPIQPVPGTVSGADVCIAFGPALEPVELIGERAQRPTGEAPGKVRIEYLRPGARSWWSLALGVARRMGRGRSPSGTWIALIPIALMAAAAVIASWLILRQLGSRRTARARAALRRVPRTAWGCALVACLSAASWSIVMPPFQVPDEPSHFAYVQQWPRPGVCPR